MRAGYGRAERASPCNTGHRVSLSPLGNHGQPTAARTRLH